MTDTNANNANAVNSDNVDWSVLDLDLEKIVAESANQPIGETFQMQSVETDTDADAEADTEAEYTKTESHMQSEPMLETEEEPIDQSDAEDEATTECDESVIEAKAPAERKKRGMPAKFLENQKKYLDAMEKQQRMLNSKKKKGVIVKKKSAATPVSAKATVAAPTGRRVIVAGKVKYLPAEPVEPQVPAITEPVAQPVTKPVTPPLPETNIYKKLALELTERESKPRTGTKNKVPGKYARQMESEVKKQTAKNVRNFSDLRRIQALDSIDPNTDIDTTKASVVELRKLRIEQRKREQADLKKKADANKRESAIQEILKNDKMSKFAKTVAIKNLSVNSRNRRNNQRLLAE